LKQYSNSKNLIRETSEGRSGKGGFEWAEREDGELIPLRVTIIIRKNRSLLKNAWTQKKRYQKMPEGKVNKENKNSPRVLS